MPPTSRGRRAARRRGGRVGPAVRPSPRRSGRRGGVSNWRDCHFADAISPSRLKQKGGAGCRRMTVSPTARRRSGPPTSRSWCHGLRRWRATHDCWSRRRNCSGATSSGRGLRATAAQPRRSDGTRIASTGGRLSGRLMAARVGPRHATRLSFCCTPLRLVGVSIGMARGCQQSDSLADGYRLARGMRRWEQAA